MERVFDDDWITLAGKPSIYSVVMSPNIDPYCLQVFAVFGYSPE